MTRNEIAAHNAGVNNMAALAAASADALRSRLTVAPTRYNFAISALDAIVEGSTELLLPLPPDDTAAAALVAPKPIAPTSESSDQIGCKEAVHGC